MCQQNNQLVVLPDCNRNANTVDAGLDQTRLLLTLANENWIKHKGGVVLEFDLRMNLSLNDLGWEVAQIEG